MNTPALRAPAALPIGNTTDRPRSPGRPRTERPRNLQRVRSFPFLAVGEKLREQRLPRKLTLRAVAELSGVSASQISEIEGGHKATFESAYRLCAALETRMSTVLRRVEDAGLTLHAVDAGPRPSPLEKPVRRTK